MCINHSAVGSLGALFLSWAPPARGSPSTGWKCACVKGNIETSKRLRPGSRGCVRASCVKVLPLLFVRQSAAQGAGLSLQGFTHVLNAAHSDGGGRPTLYEGLGIVYMGIRAHDSCRFDMSVHFQAAAAFIHGALSRGGENGTADDTKHERPTYMSHDPQERCWFTAVWA